MLVSIRTVNRLAPSMACIGRALLNSVLLGGLFASHSVTAQAASGPAEQSLRTLRYQREDENWGWLPQGAAEVDQWDFLKYVDLPGSAFVTFGLDARANYEWFENENWGATPYRSNSYSLTRGLLHADWRWTSGFRLFTQLKAIDVRGRDGGPRPVIDRNELDLHQLFLEAQNSSPWGSVTLRAGRQELFYGRMRVLSTRDGAINGRQSQDGIRAMFRKGAWRVDAFAVKNVATLPGVFDDKSDGEPYWAGLYATRSTSPSSGVDLYTLGLSADRSIYYSGVGRERRYTFGSRWWSQKGSWDYDVEALYQVGEFGQLDIRAYSSSAEVGYSLKDAHWAPRLYAAATMNSGDRDTSDRELNTYRPLQSRSPYGQMPSLGYSNVEGFQLGIAASPYPALRITLRNFWLWRNSTAEGIYSGGYFPLRGGISNQPSRIGMQSELELEYSHGRHLRLGLVAAQLSAGPFIQANAPSEPIHYMLGSVAYRF